MKTKKNNALLAVTTLICLLPVLAGALLYHRLPEQLPVNWSFSGEITRYASRLFVVLELPLLMAAANLILHLAINFDPKQANASNPLVGMGKWTVPLIGVAMQSAMLSGVLQEPSNGMRWMPLILGVVFVLTGNYLPKCSQNYTVGIKLPWTLQDEDNWDKTHRLAGYVWVIGGLVLVVGSFFLPQWFFLGVLLVIVLIPAGYSFQLYRKKHGAQ